MNTARKIAASLVLVTALSAGGVATATTAHASGQSSTLAVDACRDRIPLPTGHYFGVNDHTIRSHSGLTPTDRAYVQMIQRVLNSPDLHYGLAVDGIFGPLTEAAVVKFQRVLKSLGESVTVNGRYDAATWFAAYNQGWGDFQC